MNRYINPSASIRLSLFGFATGSAILTFEPIKWLFNTWRDPSYASTGWLYLVVISVLLVWSLTSPRSGHAASDRRMAIKLLVAAAILRLVSQVAAINIIGGIALALDIFALLTFFGLSHRARALSPFWVSILFLFTLPFERIVQRILGYPMQEISAYGACGILTPFVDELVCEGVRLKVANQDVLVDLPCSGTVSLMLCLATVVTLNAIYRPTLINAFGMIAVTIVCSIVGNAIRIALLAVGLVFQDSLGIQVMEKPLHDMIGYATIFGSLAPLIWLYRLRSDQNATNKPHERVSARNHNANLYPGFSALFIIAAIIIVSLPRQALDVSGRIEKVDLPFSLNGIVKKSQPLMAVERAYFEQYGGTAQKALYGPMALTLVNTSSPLRHLHSPDDCLRGLGYNVSFIGTRFAPVPTAIYKAEDASGSAWQVAVTFTASTGFATSNVAEAIWHWLRNPTSSWQSIQRITPWQFDDNSRENFEQATIAALDIPSITN